MEQMAFDFGVDPTACPHRRATSLEGISMCMAHEGTYVRCTESTCGEPPTCYYEPLDNSPEAVRRRIEWMMRNGSQRRD